MSGGWAVLQRRHSAAASWKAAGWRDEGLPQRCRRRAGCRSAWKRHDDERHRCQSHGFSQSTESLGFAEHWPSSGLGCNKIAHFSSHSHTKTRHTSISNNRLGVNTPGQAEQALKPASRPEATPRLRAHSDFLSKKAL